MIKINKNFTHNYITFNFVHNNNKASINKLIKRHVGTSGLMASKTIMKVPELLTAIRIINHSLNLLRKGPTTHLSLVSFIRDAALIDPKIFQHCFSVLYPNFTLPAHIGEAILKTKICQRGDLSLDFGDVMAASFVPRLIKTPFFSSGHLETLASPPYDKTNPRPHLMPSDKSLQMQNTGQRYPDYIYKFENGQLRYYDLKTGQIRPMQGHIYCTSNMEIYEQQSHDLFKVQRNVFENLGPNYKHFAAMIKELQKNVSLTWIDRNIKLHKYYQDHLNTLEPMVNPSMIFHMPLSYEFTQDNYEQVNKFQITTRSFEDVETSRKTMVRILFDRGLLVRTNYKTSDGVCSQIVKDIQSLEEVD